MYIGCCSENVWQSWCSAEYPFKNLLNCYVLEQPLSSSFLLFSPKMLHRNLLPAKSWESKTFSEPTQSHAVCSAFLAEGCMVAAGSSRLLLALLYGALGTHLTVVVSIWGQLCMLTFAGSDFQRPRFPISKWIRGQFSLWSSHHICIYMHTDPHQSRLFRAGNSPCWGICQIPFCWEMRGDLWTCLWTFISWWEGHLPGMKQHLMLVYGAYFSWECHVVVSAKTGSALPSTNRDFSLHQGALRWGQWDSLTLQDAPSTTQVREPASGCLLYCDIYKAIGARVTGPLLLRENGLVQVPNGGSQSTTLGTTEIEWRALFPIGCMVVQLQAELHPAQSTATWMYGDV